MGLAKEYNKCLAGNRTQGWIIEEDIKDNDTEATFILKYRNENSSDPMPIVDWVKAGSNKLLKAPKKGEKLSDSTTIVCERDPKVGFTLSMQTSREDVNYPVPASELTDSNSGMPVGTIISSFLKWDNFQITTKNNSNNPNGNIWSDKYSKWSPCDGRKISNSSFTTKAGGASNTPDLRGLFLRGLNVFDPTEATHVSNEQKDPDERAIESKFQSDEIKSHNHPVSDNPKIMVAMGEGWRNVAGGDAAQSTFAGQGVGTIGHRGSIETRPKNIAVYYYMKIN